MQPLIKIAITDDHPLVITGIEKVLAGFKHFELTGSYQNGEDLLNGLKNQQPDVLLLDIQMPGQNGDELARIIHKQYPAIRILALTGFDTPFYVRSMLQSGCKGYLLKNTGQQTLIEAIETVYRGEQYIEAGLKEALLGNMLKLRKQKSSATPALTDREKDVLKLIVAEYSSPEIAKELFLSLRTVENYRLHLLQKLQVKNTAGLVKAALELDLLED
jgi:DNA-binding NarL/FixJ family response regulator